MFLSSHLMTEMAQTAEHLVVIGRGRLIADTSVAEFVARASTGAAVRVVSPQATELRDALAGARRPASTARATTCSRSTASAGRRSARSPGRADRAARADAAPALARGRVHAAHRRVRRVPRRPPPSPTTDHEGRSMSAHPPPSKPPSARPRRRERVTQARVIRSEWTKLWSLRSTRWTLLVAILAMAGLGPLIATVQMNRWDHMAPATGSTSTRSTPGSAATTSPSSRSACSACSCSPVSTAPVRSARRSWPCPSACRCCGRRRATFAR